MGMLEIKAQVTASRFNFTLPRVRSPGAEDSHQELEHPGVAGVGLPLAEQEGEQEGTAKVGVCWCGISGGHAGSQLPAPVASKRLSRLFLSLTLSQVFSAVVFPSPALSSSRFPSNFQKQRGESGARSVGENRECGSLERRTWSLNAYVCCGFRSQKAGIC